VQCGSANDATGGDKVLDAEQGAARPTQLIVRSEHPFNAETPESVLCRRPVTPTVDFFVRTHGPVPIVDSDDYRLTVDGEVRTPLLLSLADLRDRFEHVTVTATLACAGNRRSEIRPVPNGIAWGPGAIGTAVWGGVRLRDLLGAAGVDPEAGHVAFTGVDDCDGESFGGSVPLEKALSPEVLVAFQMNGEPLLPAHGFPVRAVVPGYVGARSVKWLTGIRVQPEPSESCFQRADYVIDGEQLGELPLTSAICRPGEDAASGPDGIQVEGYAMGQGGQRITAVEVSCDGGRTWQPADLGPDGGPWTWRLWHADVVVPPGETEIVARAVEESGRRQPEHVAWTVNPRGYMNNAWPRVRLAPR
jgi:sulfite oxidase